MPVISVRVDRRTYEVLAGMAEARGVSLYSFVKMLLEAQVSSQVSGEVSSEVSSQVSCRELERKLSELTSKVSYLEEKIRELTAGNPASPAGTASKVAVAGGAPSTTNPPSQAGEGYEWCRSKANVRNLQSFIKWVDEHFNLIDWWDEGDRYCFKTKKKPAKTE
jgi:hypothetical protein